MHHVCGGACGVRKRILDPLVLELQMVVNSPTWRLRSEPRFSASLVQALNHGAISPAWEDRLLTMG